MSEPDEEEEEEVLLLPSDQIRQAIANRNRASRVARLNDKPYEPDNFTGAFRGVPTVHRGSQYVRPEQTIGDETHCWCGELLNHTWPGKENGRKHPKEGTMATQVLDRRNLSAYNRSIQDFILMAVQNDGLDYKIKNNSVLLYPPDGSTAVTVFARNTDRQLRSLEQWYRKHVIPSRDEPVKDTAPIERLAEKINDPVEHPRDKTPASTKDYLPPPDGFIQTPEPPATLAAQEPEVVWTQYITTDKTPSPWWDTDGQGNFRCRACWEEGKSYYRDTNVGLGGHVRATHKGGLAAVRTPEAQAKAISTRTRRIQIVREVAAAVKDLIDEYNTQTPNGLGIDLGGGDTKKLEAENAVLRRENDELKAKMALMREAMGL